MLSWSWHVIARCPECSHETELDESQIYYTTQPLVKFYRDGKLEQNTDPDMQVAVLRLPTVCEKCGAK